MKRSFTILTTLAVLLVCLFLLPTEVEAAEVASGTCGDNLTWVLDDSGTLTISGTGNMYSYASFDDQPWRSVSGSIKNVIIENGVTSIGNYAFRGCTSLTSVTIPNSITSISDWAFADCARLTSVTIGNGVTRIGDQAFWGCSGLTSITIPNSVTSIGNSAFCGCSGLTSITIPDSVTSIGNSAFSSCSGLASVTIGNGVTSIGNHAFLYCERLTSITIPNSVTSIGSNAFNKCYSLTSVVIPDSVTHIGEMAFYSCRNLIFISISNNVTRIETKTFRNCEKLTTVILGACVTDIANDAFYKCAKLSHVLYKGSEQAWAAINIANLGNDNLLVSTRHYNCTGNEITEQGCSICQANCTHNWNSGTVTKQATCKEEGVKSYTCSICKGTKTEAIDKLTTHSFGNWTKVNDTTHKRTCSVCAKEETANHTWNSGTVTKKATCKEEGIKTKTCSVCSATKTETIAKLTTHTYDNDCDTACNICGETRTVTHKYSTTWSKDKDSHWHVCSVCAKVADKAAHTPGAAATETTAQACTTCGYVINAPLGHTHKYETAWSKDASGHWHACACGAQNSYAAHSYQNSCDTDCDICGQTRTVTHTPGPDATATTDQVCTVCGKVLQHATGENPTEPSTEPPTEPATEPSTEPVTEPATEPSTNAPTEPDAGTPSDPADGNEEQNDPTTVIVIVAVVALAGGGAAAGIILWKKKH